MRRSSMFGGLAALLWPVLLAPACEAAPREPFETVKGWEIERSVGDASANPCLMSHTYEDKDDNNATNAIILALDGSEAVIVLVYQGWGWDKDERLKIPFALDKRVVIPKSNWVGDGKTLTGKFPDSIVPQMLAAKRIILRFEDGEADFDIAEFAAGYESLRRCDAAKAANATARSAPAASPSAPAVPSQARIQAYALGVTLQTAIKECDVATTGTQRAAVEAKMAALQPEMAAIDGQIRTEMAKREGPRCPGPADGAKFQEMMQAFIEKSPEAFAASLDGMRTTGGEATTPKP